MPRLNVEDQLYTPIQQDRVPNPDVPEERPQWNARVLSEIEKHEPEFCECARIGKRSLSWAPWVPGVSSNPGSAADRNNLEFAHEHVYFEGSGHNVGYGPKGLFGEDVPSKGYRFEDTCYDGSLMRRALGRISSIGDYSFFFNNCQDFANKVRESYRELIGAKK
ncbi:MAG: hypothetical protein KDD60_09355 [Bdellovibrionales bacterium]|nr:hypothetical protein [Bdellovibrionales bacterium]